MINPDNDKKWSRIRKIVFVLLLLAFVILILVTMIVFAQNYQKIINNFVLILFPVAALAIKNKPVTTHSIDLLLDCGHITVEPIEAAIFTPEIGEKRFCPTCQKETTIKKVGMPFWNDN